MESGVAPKWSRNIGGSIGDGGLYTSLDERRLLNVLSYIIVIAYIVYSSIMLVVCIINTNVGIRRVMRVEV
jgi:hypothetical protein